ncbi:retrotransposon protein, putative, ty1-copia subclass [Tanacetum coccineum]
MDGTVHTYKARLVAKGYTQTPGINYKETFSPITDIRAIRILIAINGYLPEEVCMEQPEGFVNPKYPKRVCKLKRSIYRRKQPSRQWNKRFDDEIKKFGFTQNRDEPCVYLKASGSNVTFLILYVDDILIMGNNIPMEISIDLRLTREINALCDRLTAVVDEREAFVDELDMLAGKYVPSKMVGFTKQVQNKDIPNLMKLQILGREFELRAQEKELFIEKLNVKHGVKRGLFVGFSFVVLPVSFILIDCATVVGLVGGVVVFKEDKDRFALFLLLLGFGLPLVAQLQQELLLMFLFFKTNLPLYVCFAMLLVLSSVVLMSKTSSRWYLFWVCGVIFSLVLGMRMLCILSAAGEKKSEGASPEGVL